MDSTSSDLVTQVILAVFRTNGRLLSSGDALVAPLGLTSARWQVLGAISMAQTPLSAPQIGAAMGVTRQASQKQLNLLLGEELVELLPNPGKRRSPLYRLTTRGQDIYAEVSRIQARWADRLAQGLEVAQLEAARRVLDALGERLGAASDEVTP